MDIIIIALLIVVIIGLAAVLYSCCCMSGKIDRLAELEDIDEELEKLKKKNIMKITRRKESENYHYGKECCR